MFTHILVPTDGSKLSLKAAKTAADLAHRYKARITALYVVEPYMPPMGAEGMVYYSAYTPEEYDRSMKKVADKALEQVKAAADEKGVAFEGISVTHPQPWDAIVKTASKEKCDVIVMSSHGRRGMSGLLLGSETTKVLTHSKTPVLVCR